ncbi:MAG: DUF4097 family beta strand repeat-containing protein [Actinomycetota bacterium]|nr:DUF4097 family beta strand repeat-containing protein [Actinomycetota bacterium]
MRRVLTLILLMAIAAGVAYLLMRTVARTEVTDVFSVPAPITEVSVGTGAGSVAVDAGPDDVLTARITKGYAFFAPEVTTSATAGKVVLDTDCPTLGVLTGCSVDFDVVTPPSAAVRATSTAGSVMVTGTAGAVVAQSTAGGVAVLRSRADDIRASSTAGDVRVEADRAPQRIEASTTAGGVTIVVPRGDYRIDAGAGAGAVNLEGIADTPSSSRVIIASASAGDVTIRAR